MIAMDAYQAYIVFAQYNEGYVRFLCHRDPASDDFLTMAEYGPFDLRNLNTGLEPFLKAVAILMMYEDKKDDPVELSMEHLSIQEATNGEESD